MTVEMLQGKLLTHEMAMKNDESDDDSWKKKSVAFKSSSKDESDSDEEDDEEFIVLARKFKSFLRKDKLKNQGQQKKYYKSSKGKGESSKKDETICYKCKKARHIKSECPNNDEKSLKAKKKKKAMVATWSCSEDSSSSKEVSDMEAHICLMANDDTDEIRDIYDGGDYLVLVTIDRQSAFYRVLASIPFIVALEQKEVTKNGYPLNIISSELDDLSFSGKECEFLATQMSKLDLNDYDEKTNIEIIFWNAMGMLSDDDKKLPQVSNMLPLLKRGIGVHHSGLLPILKEVIEILFQEGLIKVRITNSI
ncbi:hypothetical protein SLEP1_g47668 [Rubroshorea leprosula]|uniref:CCHC-type domain-containing protein n=1 Tax=Rubroshorea leprosula TaxID=152421 RepID=A0AAV5LR89_9ROSI|nr:hypothetical protein SLEP1_g47668 [Rubroshorea leprosula]